MSNGLSMHWQAGYLTGTTRPEGEGSDGYYTSVMRKGADSGEMIAICLKCEEPPEWCEKHCAHLTERERRERLEKIAKAKAEGREYKPGRGRGRGVRADKGKPRRKVTEVIKNDNTLN